MTTRKTVLGIETLALAGLLLLPRAVLDANAASPADDPAASQGKSDDSAASAQGEATPAAKSSHKHHRHHRSKDASGQPAATPAGSPSGGSDSTGSGD